LSKTFKTEGEVSGEADAHNKEKSRKDSKPGKQNKGEGKKLAMGR